MDNNNRDLNFIEVGKITSLHSFRGEVKIQLWCDGAEFLMGFDELYLEGGECLRVSKMRPHKSAVIASFAGIETEADALKLKNKVLYIDRDDAGLEEGVFFIADLIGLPVLDFGSGEKYGVLADIFSNGANDIYVVDCGRDESGKKREAMVPNVREFIKKVSLGLGDDDNDNGGQGVFVAPLEGMFDF